MNSHPTSPPQLPFLPGYRVDVYPKDRHHKSHLFDVSNGIRVDLLKDKEIKNLTLGKTNNLTSGAYDSSALMNSMALSSTNTHTQNLINKEYKEAVDAKFQTPQATMSRLPAWVAYDRKVLRFFGYFKESIHSSPVENWRVRKCIVYYYLEDDSIHIAEPKIENSGIPQGVFIKRHRIPKKDTLNMYYSINDLFIGTELFIYGKIFRLVDCDEFTRAFYQQNGVELAPPESYPLDSFTKKQTINYEKSHNKLMNPLKNFMEASLGKHMNNIGGIQATQQFLQNDGKVLRFYAQWDDTSLYGEKRPYVIHFFLADNTVEVNEVNTANSGRDNFSCLLKRQKLPKNYYEIGLDLNKIGLLNNNDSNESGNNKVNYYSIHDFKIGQYINVYGRNLLLCACDEFTKNYYITNFNMSPNDFPRLNMSEEENNDRNKTLKLQPPPHNGFGSDEDSLSSFLYLIPRIPKQDFKKLIELDRINLRFLAKFINPSKIDKDRTFIITFYLSNDTLQVYEKFERNSGFIGGKFLERSRLKNPHTNEYFKPSDFFIGSQINVNKNLFQIVDIDEYTAKFIKNNQHIWSPQAVHNSINGFNQSSSFSSSSSSSPSSSFANESTQQQIDTGADRLPQSSEMNQHHPSQQQHQQEYEQTMAYNPVYQQTQEQHQQYRPHPQEYHHQPQYGQNLASF